ncbi:MAG: phosphotransferase [Chitinophagaceae bacterium]|nr:phosphotransferase [Chitinophagaceae bacterium]
MPPRSAAGCQEQQEKKTRRFFHIKGFYTGKSTTSYICGAMNIFPTQYSTLSATALKDHLEKQFGFRGMHCRLLVRNVSDTYILEGDSGKFVFKIYRDNYRRLNEIRAEVELLNILHAKGAPVAYPIADIQGSYIQSFQAAEGIRNGVLFYFAPGTVILLPDEKQLKIIGREIARMHIVMADVQLRDERPVYDTYTTLRRPLELVRRRFEELPEEYAWLQDIAGKADDKLKSFRLEELSYGYCHYDLLAKNFHFDSQDRITFFDFDWCGKGWLVNDLMTFYITYFLQIHMGRITQEEADKAFAVAIKGYREQRSLSAAEIEAIPYLGIMFWIFALGFYEENFDDFSNTFLSTRFLKERTALIRKWVESYCKF